MTDDQENKNAKELHASAARHSDARRRLLKTIAAGGAAGAALPEKWVKPVVDATLLPAHAQATGATACSFISMSVSVASDEFTDSSPQIYNTSGGHFDYFISEGPVGFAFAVTAQVSGTPGGPFNLDYTSSNDQLVPVASDSNANAVGGTVTFPIINAGQDAVFGNANLTFTVTPPTGCGSPRVITVTLQED